MTVALGAREDDVRSVARAEDATDTRRPPFESKLGVSVEPVSDEVANRAGLSESQRGLAITAVDPDGPAADKGLGPRQIITHVNNERVRSVAEFRQILGSVRGGDVVSLQIFLPPADPSQAGQSVVVRLRAAG